ncbi:hypothetical protein Bbelb_366720 [Branchiostoma belcheri]|nr:hypothetical protein Bbelb_366720 [Branchiostoma belcheri]
MPPPTPRRSKRNLQKFQLAPLVTPFRQLLQRISLSMEDGDLGTIKSLLWETQNEEKREKYRNCETAIEVFLHLDEENRIGDNDEDRLENILQLLEATDNFDRSYFEDDIDAYKIAVENQENLQRDQVTLDLVGRDDDMNALLGKIDADQREHVKVVSITGLGGVGKTTFAHHACAQQEREEIFIDLREVTTVENVHLKIMREFGFPLSKCEPERVYETIRSYSGPESVIIMDNADGLLEKRETREDFLNALVNLILCQLGVLQEGAGGELMRKLAGRDVITTEDAKVLANSYVIFQKCDLNTGSKMRKLANRDQDRLQPAPGWFRQASRHAEQAANVTAPNGGTAHSRHENRLQNNNKGCAAKFKVAHAPANILDHLSAKWRCTNPSHSKVYPYLTARQGSRLTQQDDFRVDCELCRHWGLSRRTGAKQNCAGGVEERRGRSRFFAGAKQNGAGAKQNGGGEEEGNIKEIREFMLQAYNSLPVPLQHVLVQVSVFAGPFTKEAAEKVLGGGKVGFFLWELKMRNLISMAYNKSSGRRNNLTARDCVPDQYPRNRHSILMDLDLVEHVPEGASPVGPSRYDMHDLLRTFLSSLRVNRNFGVGQIIEKAEYHFKRYYEGRMRDVAKTMKSDLKRALKEYDEDSANFSQFLHLVVGETTDVHERTKHTEDDDRFWLDPAESESAHQASVGVLLEHMLTVDERIRFYNSRMNAAKEQGKWQCAAEMMCWLAENILQNQSFQAARRFLDEAFKTLQDLPNGGRETVQLSLARYHYVEGVYYSQLGQYEENVQQLQKAFEIQSEIIGDDIMTARTVNSLGFAHHRHARTVDRDPVEYMNILNQGLERHRQAYEMVQRAIGSDQHIDCPTYLMNIGTMYLDMGWYYSRENIWALSSQNFDKALEYFDKAGQSNSGLLHYNMARCYQAKRQYDNAISQGQQALDIFRKNYDRHPDIADTVYLIGKFHHEKKDYESARKMYMESLELNKDLGDRRVDGSGEIEGKKKVPEETIASIKTEEQPVKIIKGWRYYCTVQ